jgi:hypothetical protein
MSDLKKRIEDCLNDEGDDTAADLLKEHAAEMDDADVAKLVEHAFTDEEDDDNIVDFYSAVIGRVDADLAKRLHTALSEVEDKDLLFETMEEDGAVPFHGALLDELDPGSMDDDDLVNMLIQVTKLSRENRRRVARAISVDDSPDVNDYVTGFKAFGSELDDETLDKLIVVVAGSAPEDGAPGEEGDDPDGAGGEVGEKP